MVNSLEQNVLLTNNEVISTNTVTNIPLNEPIKQEEKKVKWTIDHEDILIEWADKAMCYRWLHARSHVLYSRWNYRYTIPVIIISTLTGTANFSQDRVPVRYQNMFIMCIGAFNILAGIITTIQQFLKISQFNEAHRVASIAWDKFYRNVKVEISRNPSERMPVIHMLKNAKDEFDRLTETCPIIPDSVINEFKNKFQSSYEYAQIKKPEICDILVSTENARNNWFIEEVKLKKTNNLEKEQNKIKKYINDFKEKFQEVHGREPLDNEILDNLSTKIEKNILQQALNDDKV
jgi:hypothetical protein